MLIILTNLYYLINKYVICLLTKVSKLNYSILSMIHKFFNYLFKNQVLLTLFIIVTGWVIVQIQGILLSFFLSYIIMAFNLPYVSFLRKRRVPKLLAVIIPFFAMLVAIFLLILPLVPFVLGQIQNLILRFPIYLEQAMAAVGFEFDPRQLQSYFSTEINTISQNAISVTTQVFGGLFSMLMIFIISFYLLLYYDEFKKLIAKMFKSEKHNYVLSTLDEVNHKLGAWLRGQIVLMVFIGFLSYVTLTFLNIPNALPLALLSGLLEIVPTVGPILSSIPAIIVALTMSPTLAITVIVIYIVLQLIENNLLVPKVMEKVVGLNPVVVIMGVLIGANLMGLAGGLLAIPLITFIIVIYKSISKKQA